MPLLVLLLLLAPMPALAVVVYDDGDVHVVDGPSDAVEVVSGTTVLTVPGAEIGSPFFPGIESRGGSTVGIFGGVATGSGETSAVFPTGHSVVNPADPGIEAQTGAVTIDAGEVLGGNGFGEVGGHGLVATDVDSVTISGGLVRGGERGGSAVVMDGWTDAAVSGGALEGGPVEEVSLGLAPALHLMGNSRTRVTGGSFMGGLAADDPAAIGLSLLIDESASVEIRGGTFDGPWTIRGPDAVVSVYGRDLFILGVCGGLSPCQLFVGGQLEDSSSLSVELNLEDGAALPVLHEVPEPSVTWLGIAALGALGVLRRSARGLGEA